MQEESREVSASASAVYYLCKETVCVNTSHSAWELGAFDRCGCWKYVGKAPACLWLMWAFK